MGKNCSFRPCKNFLICFILAAEIKLSEEKQCENGVVNGGF